VAFRPKQIYCIDTQNLFLTSEKVSLQMQEPYNVFVQSGSRKQIGGLGFDLSTLFVFI